MTDVVAEIGQNHNGSVTIAEALIDMAADPRPAAMNDAPQYRCHAVKFVKRDLEHELTPKEMGRRYDGRHSFGRTYGEHRKALELSNSELSHLYDYARDQQLKVYITLCHPSCLEILDYFVPDALKVASRDLTNLPLLEALAETGIPMILSTGMADRVDLDDAVGVVTQYHKKLTIMHCLSAYPAPMGELNLQTIRWLRTHYYYTIGYSDHTVGIMAPVAAAAMGASVIEKHITLDRTMRGTDQAGSLERDGLYRLLRDLDALDRATGTFGMYRSEACENARRKLERTIATSADLPAGTVITESDVELLSPGTGYKWRNRYHVIGRTTTHNLPRGEIIMADDIA